MNNRQLKAFLILYLFLSYLNYSGFVIYNKSYDILEWNVQSCGSVFIEFLCLIIAACGAYLFTEKELFGNK